jgi:Protein of unknown function (DUF4231)
VVYTPSLTFQQEQKELQNKRLVGDIDDIEYSRLIDELIMKEAHDQQAMIIELAVQEMRESQQRRIQGYEEEKMEREEKQKRKIEEEERLRHFVEQRVQQDEGKRERQRQYQEQLQKEKEARTKAQSRQNYREVAVPGEIAMLKRKYQTAQNRYTVLQIVSVFASIIAASMVGLDIAPRWLVAIFSTAAAIATGLLATFKVRERNYSYYQAISNMETECHNYDQRIDHYADIDEERAFRHFSSRISEIKQEHISQELAFWKAEEKSTREEEAQRSLPHPEAESKENPEEQKSAEEPLSKESEHTIKDSNKEQSQPGGSQ